MNISSLLKSQHNSAVAIRTHVRAMEFCQVVYVMNLTMIARKAIEMRESPQN